MYDFGDVIVVVMFFIYNWGSEFLYCGLVRWRIGFDVVLGVKFVIDKINENSDIFLNKRVGFFFFGYLWWFIDNFWYYFRVLVIWVD